MCSSFGLLQVHLASVGPTIHCCTVSPALYAEAYLRLHNTSNSLLRLLKILVRWCCAFALLASRSMCTVAPLRFRSAQMRLSLMESSRTSNELSRKHVRHPRGMLINYILQDRIQVNHT